MAQPNPLFPHPLGPQQSLREWAESWAQQHCPNPTQLGRDAVRLAMWNALPKIYLPNLHDLWRMWWMRAFADIARSLDWVFTDGRGGYRLDAQLALPFLDFEAYEVEKLRLAKADIDGVREELEEYIVYNGLVNINVDQTMKRWQKAAGF